MSDDNGLMVRVARLEKEVFYLQDRVAVAERALIAAHGTGWMKQITLNEAKPDESASE
jgi:hypothetical protein